jgi:hypothetical protein
MQKKQYSQELKDRAIEMWLAGTKINDICKALGITSRYTFKDWQRAYKINNVCYADSVNKVKNDRFSYDPDGELIAQGSIGKMTRNELEKIAYEARKLQFERDCAIVELEETKKSMGLIDGKEGKSSIKSEIYTPSINRLSPKYNVSMVAEAFNISRQAYYRPKVDFTDKWQWYFDDISQWMEDNIYLKGKIGRDKLIKKIKEAGQPIHMRKLKEYFRELDWLMIQSKSMKRHNSFQNDGIDPYPNYLFGGEEFDFVTGKFKPIHYFKQDKHWQVLGADVTEFHLNGFKVFLSNVIDFCDSAPVAWTVSRHPDTDLIASSFKLTASYAPIDARFILHMDQGSVNRSHAIRGLCDKYHILPSNSRKGASGDNAPTEGFFGRLKQMFFNNRDFTGMSYEEFAYELDKFMRWYQSEIRSNNTMEKKA